MALPLASVRVTVSRDRSKQRAEVLVRGEVVAQLPLHSCVAEATPEDATLTLKLPMALGADDNTTEWLTWVPEAR